MAVDAGELSHLLLAIYRSAREQPLEDFQQAVLKLVEAHLPFDSSTWGAGKVSASGLTVHSAHLYREIPNRYILYEEVKHQDPVTFLTATNVGRTLNLHFPTLYAAREKAGMREYARRVRHQNTLVTTLPHSNQALLRWISLYRAAPDSTFSDRERRLCELLVPHLMEGLATNQVLHLKSLDRGERRACSSTAIVDYQGVVHSNDPTFAALLDKEWPYRASQALPQPLQDAILNRDFQGYSGRVLFVAFSRIKDLVILKVREKVAADHLTARELEIARHIAAGLSHKEIARKLDLSPATVRNHTQRIHDRLGIRSNAELAAHLEGVGEPAAGLASPRGT